MFISQNFETLSLWFLVVEKNDSDGHRVITMILEGIVSALKTSLRIMERGVETGKGMRAQ